MIIGAAATTAARRRARQGRTNSRDIDQPSTDVIPDNHEEDLSLLHSMFPDWDEELLFMLFQRNSYRVDLTIDNVLSMNDASENPTNTVSENEVSNTQTESSAEGGGSSDRIDFEVTGANNTSTTNNLEDESEKFSDLATAMALSLSAAESQRDSVTSNGEQNNEIVPPLHASQESVTDVSGGSYELSDEQLAFMLQNDSLFQQELAAHFGDEYLLQFSSFEDMTGAADTLHNAHSTTHSMTKPTNHIHSSTEHEHSSIISAAHRGLGLISSEMRRQLHSFTETYLTGNKKPHHNPYMSNDDNSIEMNSRGSNFHEIRERNRAKGKTNKKMLSDWGDDWDRDDDDVDGEDHSLVGRDSNGSRGSGSNHSAKSIFLFSRPTSGETQCGNRGDNTTNVKGDKSQQRLSPRTPTPTNTLRRSLSGSGSGSSDEDDDEYDQRNNNNNIPNDGVEEEEDELETINLLGSVDHTKDHQHYHGHHEEEHKKSLLGSFLGGK